MTRRRSASAISMTEVVVASVLVSLVLTASLQTVSAARLGSERLAERTRGLALAQDLMSEILQQDYSDPDNAPDSSGLGATGLGGSFEILGVEFEISDGTRAAFDDVSDYHGWAETPPARKDGTIMAGHDGWARRVEVRNVSTSDFDSVSAIDTGLKRVKVDVIHNGRVVATLVGLRTAAWQKVLEKR